MCLNNTCFEFTPEGAVQIVKTISIFELISIVGIIIAIVSLIIALRASKTQNATRRAEFSFRIWEAFVQDDIQQAYLEIEWADFKYPYNTDSGFRSDAQERRIDKLLYLFDEMASLYEQSILTTSDKTRWAYHGKRIYHDEGIQNYMHFLDGFFEKNGMKNKPHDISRRVFANDSHS